MSDLNTPITGQESMWDIIKPPTSDELALINASPLLVQELNEYQNAIDNGPALPFDRDTTDGPTGLQTVTMLNGSTIQLQCQFGSYVIGSSADVFVGELSYELGHFVNFGNDLATYNQLVGNLSPDDPSYATMSAIAATLAESESQANNFAIQQQILQATTLNPNLTSIGQPVQIHLNGDSLSGGALQSAFDQAFAADKANGVNPADDLGMLAQAVSGITATVPTGQSGDDAGLDFFQFYEKYPVNVHSYYYPDSSPQTGLQGAQDSTSTGVGFTYNPDGSLQSVTIDDSSGQSQSFSFTGSVLSSATVFDQFGDIISTTDYTHNTDGSYTATVLDGQGDMATQYQFSADGSTTQLNYDAATGELTGETIMAADGSLIIDVEAQPGNESTFSVQQQGGTVYVNATDATVTLGGQGAVVAGNGDIINIADGTAGNAVTIEGDGVTLNASGGIYDLTGNNDIVNASNASITVNPDVYDGPNSFTLISGSNNEIDVGSAGTVRLTGGDDTVQVDEGGYGYVQLLSGSNYTVNIAGRIGGVKVYGDQDDDITLRYGYEDLYTAAGVQTGQIDFVNGSVSETATFAADGSMAENQYFYSTGQLRQDNIYTNLADGILEQTTLYSASGAVISSTTDYSGSGWAETTYYDNGGSGTQMTSTTQVFAGTPANPGALLSEVTDYSDGTSCVAELGNLPPGATGEAEYFSGLDGTGTETSKTILWADGTSQKQVFTDLPDGVSAEIYNYVAPTGNEVSLLQALLPQSSAITDYTDGTSSEVFYTGLSSDESSVTSWFNGADATGLTETMINLTDRTSQIDLFAGLGSNESEVIENFSQWNGAGTETSAITDYTTGGSSETLYTDLAAGIANETEWFSGADTTGSLTQAVLNLTNGQSQIQQFSGLAGGASELVENFAGANGTGQETWSLTDYLDGSSSATFYTGLPTGQSSQTEWYSGADGTGQVTGTLINSTDGTSELQQYSGLSGDESSLVEDFTGANATGAETWSLTNYASGGSSMSWYAGLPPDQLSETSWYSGADGTGTVTGGLVNLADGGSEILQFGDLPGDEPSLIEGFTGADGTGTEQWSITNNADGSSTVNFSTGLPSGDSSAYQDYTGDNGSGTLTSTTINFTGGGSEVQYTAGLGSGISYLAAEFSGADGTGSMTSQLTDFDSGYSQVSILDGLPAGYTSVVETYSGLDSSGQLMSEGIQESNGNSECFTFNYDASGNETSYEEQLFGAGGNQIGYSDYNAAGDWTGGNILDGFYLDDGYDDGGYFDGGYFGGGYFGGGDFGGYGFAGSKATVQAAVGSSVGSIAQADLVNGNQAGAFGAEAALAQASQVATTIPTAGTGNSVLEGAKWDSQIITWSLSDPSGADSTADAAYETQVQQAFATWAAASGLTFEEVSDPSQADIQIGFGELDTATSAVVGYTSGQAQNGQITGVSVELEDPSQDALVAGADGQLTYSGTDATLQQVLLHEIGHALGLADTADQNSIMYYELTSGNQTLDSTDITGMQSLYGTGSVSDASAAASRQVEQLIQAMAAYAAPSSGIASLAAIGSLDPQQLLAVSAH